MTEQKFEEWELPDDIDDEKPEWLMPNDFVNKKLTIVCDKTAMYQTKSGKPMRVLLAFSSDMMHKHILSIEYDKKLRSELVKIKPIHEKILVLTSKDAKNFEVCA